MYLLSLVTITGVKIRKTGQKIFLSSIGKHIYVKNL